MQLYIVKVFYVHSSWCDTSKTVNKDNDPRIGFRVNGSKTFLANSLWHGTTDH